MSQLHTDGEIAASLSRLHAQWGAEDQARSFTADQRRQLAKEGKALPDGSFPIENTGDLSNAVKLARTPAQRAHIKKRAAALGAAKAIPGEWSAADPDAAITSLLRQAISLQETDPDSKTDPQDIKVLGALRNALMVQEADNRGPEEKPEATAASMKTCPTCEGSGKVPY